MSGFIKQLKETIGIGLSKVTHDIYPVTKTSAVYNDDGSRLDTYLAQVFTSVSNGKSSIASAITGMGVTTAADATFGVMSNNLKTISDGKVKVIASVNSMGVTTASNASLDVVSENIKNISKDASAVQGDVLTGKSVYIAGAKKQGTMPDKTNSTGTTGLAWLDNTKVIQSQNQLIMGVEKGYYGSTNYSNWDKSGVVLNDYQNKLGITADKIVKGNTICGIVGTGLPNAEYVQMEHTYVVTTNPGGPSYMWMPFYTGGKKIIGGYVTLGDNGYFAIVRDGTDMLFPSFEVNAYRQVIRVGYQRFALSTLVSGTTHASVEILNNTGGQLNLPFGAYYDVI